MGGNRTRTNTWVLFVVEEIEKNVGDQKLVESCLYFDHGKIKSKRLTLRQIHEMGVMDEETGVLKIQDDEIGFVYFRSGYAEHQFKNTDGSDDERTWSARTMIECSMAVKCPNIDGHLTTFKKFQEAFSDKNIVKEIIGEK